MISSFGHGVTEPRRGGGQSSASPFGPGWGLQMVDGKKVGWIDPETVNRAKQLERERDEAEIRRLRGLYLDGTSGTPAPQPPSSGLSPEDSIRALRRQSGR